MGSALGELNETPPRANFMRQLIARRLCRINVWASPSRSILLKMAVYQTYQHGIAQVYVEHRIATRDLRVVLLNEISQANDPHLHQNRTRATESILSSGRHPVCFRGPAKNSQEMRISDSNHRAGRPVVCENPEGTVGRPPQCQLFYVR